MVVHLQIVTAGAADPNFRGFEQLADQSLRAARTHYP
jgi:hypothetical protein